MQHLTKQDLLSMLMLDNEMPDDAKIHVIIVRTNTGNVDITYSCYDNLGKEYTGTVTLSSKMLNPNDGAIITGQ